MTVIFASLTSKSKENDTCVYVDNYVEIGDFFLRTYKNRHRFRIFVKTGIATQIAKKLYRSILLCEVSSFSITCVIWTDRRIFYIIIIEYRNQEIILGEGKMNFINVFGLVFVVLIMIPNIIYALKCKDGFINVWHNKVVECLEQIGRFACMGFMIFLIPGVEFGFSSVGLFVAYLLLNTVLILVYWLIWIICFHKNTMFRALALSIIPSVIFLFSGIASRYAPLIIAAFIFAPCHILISYKNAEKSQ